MKIAAKAFIYCVLAFVFIFLCSCEDKVVDDLNIPITHENIAISLIDIFGDKDNTYIVAEVKLSENDSVYTGKIAETIISGDITGSYSTNCIGYNEDEKTQIYLVHINSSVKCKVDIDFNDYRSSVNPMQQIVNANWTFSVDLRNQTSLVKTIDVNEDGIISQIKIFENGIILIPSQKNAIEDLSNCKIELTDKFGSAITILANSLSTEKCYLSYGCILWKAPQNYNNIYKITIDDWEYLLN